jgi:hypothetical protein
MRRRRTAHRQCAHLRAGACVDQFCGEGELCEPADMVERDKVIDERTMVGENPPPRSQGFDRGSGMGIFQFYKDAVKFILPDPAALEKADESGAQHKAYHNRIVLISVICGIATCVAGTLIAFGSGEIKKGHASIGYFISVPLFSGAAGLLFGASVSCLCAS